MLQKICASLTSKKKICYYLVLCIYRCRHIHLRRIQLLHYVEDNISSCWLWFSFFSLLFHSKERELIANKERECYIGSFKTKLCKLHLLCVSRKFCRSTKRLLSIWTGCGLSRFLKFSLWTMLEIEGSDYVCRWMVGVQLLYVTDTSRILTKL